MAVPSPSTDLTGILLAGRYRLNRPIASGGMAQVFEATDEVLARRVAVKILHSHLSTDEAFVRRFRAEAVSAARLTHPSIVSVYDTVEDNGINAIVMELVSGTTLRADIDAHGPLQLSAVLAIGSQVADALGAAHANGLVHRDVKPANILLSSDGRVLVADFGIAKAAQSSDNTDNGAMVGTAKYLAPEQVNGRDVDGRTDVYALGIVLYEALTGVPPFVGDSDTATALMRLHNDPVRPRQLRPDIPVSVEAVIGKALARRPDDRFANAAAMRSALLAAGADPSRAHSAAQAAVASVAATEARADSDHVPAPLSAPQDPELDRAPMAPDGGGLIVEPEPSRRVGAVVIVLCLVAGAAAAALWSGLGGTADPGRTVGVTAYTTFDPFGTNGENDEMLANLSDDDPATLWVTETYNDPDVTVLKPGVGLVAILDEPTSVSAIGLNSPSTNWSAEIRTVHGDMPGGIDGWEVLGTIDPTEPGTTRIDLDGREATSVMVWFTHVGDDHAVQVADFEVFTR